LRNDNANQLRFALFLFHTREVLLAISFTCEKKLFFTGFPQHKFDLWKSCGFDFLRLIMRTSDKIERANTGNSDCVARQVYFRTRIAT